MMELMSFVYHMKMSKAFDTINRAILLDNLQHYFIRRIKTVWKRIQQIFSRLKMCKTIYQQLRLLHIEQANQLPQYICKSNVVVFTNRINGLLRELNSSDIINKRANIVTFIGVKIDEYRFCRRIRPTQE